MRRRDRHDIAIAILRAATLPIHKTHLMYRARLSYAQLNKYLASMIRSGLIENHRTEGKKRDEVLYKTTEKGTIFVKNLELAERLWKNDDQYNCETFPAIN